MTCKKCLKIGHTEKKCKFKEEERCKKCGENHQKNIGQKLTIDQKEIIIKANECPYHSHQLKWCTNCRETSHWSNEKTCPRYKQTQEILAHKAKHGGNFRDIKKIFNYKNPTDCSDKLKNTFKKDPIINSPNKETKNPKPVLIKNKYFQK